MEQLAPVKRLYLEPESGKERARRLSRGGNRKISFKEGWAEFADKRVAKAVAHRLNTTPMGSLTLVYILNILS